MRIIGKYVAILASPKRRLNAILLQVIEKAVGGGGELTYLSLLKDGADAVEKLKWCDHLTLDQRTGQDSSSCPPSCAYGHLPKPSLERETTTIATSAAGTATATHHLFHGPDDFHPFVRGTRK